MSGVRLVCVGGSDAGIAAALRARELVPNSDVTVVLADEYPNFSICGLPYAISGEVRRWRDLAHRSVADLEATRMRLRQNTLARSVDVEAHRLLTTNADGRENILEYDRLIIGTGAVPVIPPIDGLRGHPRLGAADGVHVLHTMDDMFAVLDSIEDRAAKTALVVGAGYIGLEMADALTVRGLRVTQVEHVTQVEQLPQVLPTVDPQLAAVVEGELAARGVEVVTGTTVTSITRVIVDEHMRTGRRCGEVAAREGNRLTVTGRTPTTTRTRAYRTCSLRATACTPITGCYPSRAICRSAPPRTSRAGWPGRTQSAVTVASPAVSALRW